MSSTSAMPQEAQHDAVSAWLSPLIMNIATPPPHQKIMEDSCVDPALSLRKQIQNNEQHKSNQHLPTPTKFSEKPQIQIINEGIGIF